MKYTISPEGQISIPASPSPDPRTVFTDKSAAEGQTYAEWNRVVSASPAVRQLWVSLWIFNIFSLFIMSPANYIAYLYEMKRIRMAAKLWKANGEKAGQIKVKAIYQGDTGIFFRNVYEIVVQNKTTYEMRWVRFQDCKCLVVLVEGGYESLALSQVNITLSKANDGGNEICITGRKRFLSPWEDKEKLDTPTRLMIQELVEGLSSRLPGFTPADVPKVVLTAGEENAAKQRKSNPVVLSALGLSLTPREQTKFNRKIVIPAMLRGLLLYSVVGGSEILLLLLLLRLFFKP